MHSFTVPSNLIRSASFTFDDVFNALGIPTPNLIFEINSSQDVIDWNLRLPAYKQSLIGAQHPNPPTVLDGALRHYQGVVRENCKRLLRGTSTACQQAGAIFRIRPLFSEKEKEDYISVWLSEAGLVPNLGLIGSEDLEPEALCQLLETTHSFNPNATEEDEDEMSKIVRIDMEPWINDQKVPKRTSSNALYHSVPSNKLSHVILSDDMALFEEKLEKAIPTGLIVVHGGQNSTKQFCKAIQKGQPVFIFKYTGSTADLACEMLVKVEQFLNKKRSNPTVRPVQPFKTSLPQNYSHPRWLWQFGPDVKASCRLLNILIENFPDRYNSASVLQIDMFNTSEEKLQDQLTKTMSVVFEGVVELGGQSAENRRLTYAWRLRHLLMYNAARQLIVADVLQALIIVLSLFTTAASVTYIYLNCIEDIDDTRTEVLLNLNLLLPLSVTILRGLNATLNPLAKWSILQSAACRVEGEIYMYRTKVGQYNSRKSSAQNDHQKTGGQNKNKQGQDDKHETHPVQKEHNPRKVFSNAIDQIWQELSASDVAKGALVDPPENSDPLDDINERLCSNMRQQKLLTEGLKEPHSTLKPLKDRSVKKGLDDDSDSDDSDASGVPLSPRFRKTYHEEDAEGDDENEFETQSEGKSDFNQSEGEGDGESDGTLDIESNHDSTTDKRKEEHDRDGAEGDTLLDDGLSTLTADEYVKLRLIPVVSSFTSKAPGLSRKLQLVTSIVLVLSVCSSVFSSFGLTLFIPLCLAFSSSLTSWVSYKQSETSLMQTNGAKQQLHQLMIWWDSLSMIEKRVPANKESLVRITETAVQGQIVSYNKSRKNEGAEDDNAVVQ